MKHKLILAVVTVLLPMGSSSVAAYADTLTITVNDPIAFVSGATGGSAIYTLTVSAPGSNVADVFLNSDSFNIASPLTLDDTDFFSNAPLFLDPGTNATFDAFAVSVLPGTAPGNYVGSFTILGGSDGGSSSDLGAVNFTTSVAPEPSSFLLLGSGLAGLYATIGRRRFHRA